MTPSELASIKNRIKNIMAARNGVGSLSNYSSSQYDLPSQEGEHFLKAEVGEKTIDLLLKVSKSAFPKLGEGTHRGGAVPEGFTKDYMNNVCQALENEQKASNRGGFNGVVQEGAHKGETLSLYNGNSILTSEKSSCDASCTGLCLGSCISQCNGCSGTCGGGCSGCSGGCGSSCTGTRG